MSGSFCFPTRTHRVEAILCGGHELLGPDIPLKPNAPRAALAYLGLLVFSDCGRIGVGPRLAPEEESVRPNCTVFYGC